MVCSGVEAMVTVGAALLVSSPQVMEDRTEAMEVTATSLVGAKAAVLIFKRFLFHISS